MEVRDKFSLGTCVDCEEEAKYAIYQLSKNGTKFTKLWVHVCDEHDKETDINNRELRNTYPRIIWIEKSGGR